MYRADSKAQKLRNKRIVELNLDNFKELRLEIPPGMLKGGPKSGKTVNSRRILASKKSLVNHLDSDPKSLERFLGIASKPSRYPKSAKCNICGYFASDRCLKCGSRFCGFKCLATHQKTICK